MNTTLISDNCLVNRQYAGGSMGGEWYARPCIVEIPQQQDFFNIFSSKVQLSALMSLKEQLQNNLHKIIRFNPDDLVVSFTKILNALLGINASSIYTQITSVNSLVIKAETPNGNIYTELFFDEITGWLNEVVVNIFKNQQLDFNNSGLLDTMILAIKQYFGNEEINYFTILNQATAYDLSGTALATTDF